MHIPKKFFEDKLALALSSASILIVILTIVTVILRLNLSNGSNFIISYRGNLGIEAFKSGGIAGIICLLIFSAVVLVLQTLLAWRMYSIERRLVIGVLSGGLFLLIICLIVSNSLLALH